MIGGRPAWLRRFGHQPVTLLRASAGTRTVHGEWNPGARSRIAIQATTAPQGRMRDVGVSGARLEAERVLWTAEAVQAATVDRDADLVEYNNETWRVIAVDAWQGFNEVSLARLEDQSGAVLEAGTSAMQRNLRRHIALGSGLYTAEADGNITVLRVIPANGPGPAPAGEHATVLVRSRQQEGEVYQGATQADADSARTATTARQVLARVSIQFFRAGAAATAERFLNWAESPAGKLSEEALELVLVPPFRDSRADALIGDRLEERVVVDVGLRYLDRLDQTTGTIENVPLELARAGFEYAATITASTE